MPRELICRVRRHGVEDTEFYRTEASDGRVLIEKRLIPGRHPLAGLMPRLEKTMLAHLATLGLPIARIVSAGYADMNSVICEFTGPNLRHLTLEPGATEQDVAALWAAAIEATARFADAGVLVTDWAARNATFRLQEGLSGKVDLRQSWLLDHALTISAADAAPVQRYPLWVSPRQLSFAPEVRSALDHEQAEAVAQLQSLGKEIRKLGDLADTRNGESLLREINLSRSSTQRHLRGGQISADAAMQYAIGQQALELLAFLEERAPTSGACTFLRGHVALLRRMSAPQARERMESLREVVHVVRDGYSEQRYSILYLEQLDLRDLILRPETGPEAASAPDATLPTREEVLQDLAKAAVASWTDTIAHSTEKLARSRSQSAASAGTKRIRTLVSQFVVAAAASALLLLLAGQAIRAVPAPGELTRHDLFTEIYRSENCLKTGLPERAPVCADRLMALAQHTDAGVAGYAEAALETSWREALASAGRQTSAATTRERLARALAIANSNYPPAVPYLEPLLNVRRTLLQSSNS